MPGVSAENLKPEMSETKVARKTILHPDPVCDFCQGTALNNAAGQPELLLFCKDCTARAHPSCMQYSLLLASRASKGPWQCMDCKTCCVCQDPGHPDQMLFCDGCDKGFHMTCHQPQLWKKPSGKWECLECKLAVAGVQRTEFVSLQAQQGFKQSLSENSAPPTPAMSPVPNEAGTAMSTLGICNIKSDYPDASDWTVDDVVNYMSNSGFPQESKIFEEQEIDGVALLLLKRSDVLQGLDLKLGPALKINRHIKGLQSACQSVL